MLLVFPDDEGYYEVSEGDEDDFLIFSPSSAPEVRVGPDESGSLVVIADDEGSFQQIVEPPGTVVVLSDDPLTTPDEENQDGTVLVIVSSGVPGPQGPPGVGVGVLYEHLMPVPATTATLTHGLGRDPVAVQVILDEEEVCEYGVYFTVPGVEVQVSFDLSIAALIRLF